jgi:tetratricopeptide (TPR) repeat protein
MIGGIVLMEDRICPVCRRPMLGMVCSGCGLDLNVANRLTATARQLLNQALEAMQNKAYVKALQYVEQGLRTNPKDSELLLLAGLCHYALGDLAQADYNWSNSQNDLATEYRQKIAEDQDGFQWIFNRYHRAIALMRDGKQRQVIKILQKALHTGPQYLPALELLAQAYYDLRRYWQCHRIMKRIEAVTVDAPLIKRLANDLYQKVARRRLVYTLLFVIIITGSGCYGLKQVIAKVKPAEVKVVYRKQIVTKDRFNREALRAAAHSLAERDDPLTGADILAAISDSQATDCGFTKAEKLLLARAAVHYYFEGRHHFCRHDYDAAAVSFIKSRSYPVRTYVYDDTLYYQAIVRERLGAVWPAIALYQQLLQEVPESNYCREAVIRWGALAEQHRELRPQFSALAQTYPQFYQLIFSRTKNWGETINHEPGKLL